MGIIWWGRGITFSEKKIEYLVQEGNSSVQEEKGVHLARM